MVAPQMCEGHALKSIDGNADKHCPDILGMVRILHPSGDGLQENQDECNESQTDAAHHQQCGRIDALRVVFLVG